MKYSQPLSEVSVSVIDFEKYRKTKNSILNRALQDLGVSQSRAAAKLQEHLRRNGWQKALVFYQGDNFVIVLKSSILAFLLSKLPLNNGHSLAGSCRSFLLEDFSDAKDIVVFRLWPTEQQAEKLMKKWELTSDLD